MSRNLCRTDCYFCQQTVKLVELPRLATKEDCDGFFDEYRGALFANAECELCKAKYLAWVQESPAWLEKYRQTTRANYYDDGPPFFDLSFSAAFNDEPDAEDLPDFVVEMVPKLTPWPTYCKSGCGRKVEGTDRECIPCYIANHPRPATGGAKP